MMALKYEIGVSLGVYCTILFVTGGWRGATHDLTIARKTIIPKLKGNESMVVDRGYRGSNKSLLLMSGNDRETKYSNEQIEYL